MVDLRLSQNEPLNNDLTDILLCDGLLIFCKLRILLHEDVSDDYGKYHEILNHS